MTNETKNALLILGLAKKAGKLVRGAPAVCEMLSAGKMPALVILSAEASENTKKRITDKCGYYGARLCQTEADPASLSHAVGDGGAVAAVAVTDEGLSRLFLAKGGEHL